MSFFLSLTLSLVSRCLSILSFLSASFSHLSLFLYPYHSICLLLFLYSLFVSVFQSVFQCLCLFRLHRLFIRVSLFFMQFFIYIHLEIFFCKKKIIPKQFNYTVFFYIKITFSIIIFLCLLEPSSKGDPIKLP